MRKRPMCTPYFQQIAAELRTSYEPAYYPTSPVKDDTFRKIMIRPKRDGLTVRTKTGYFSRRESEPEAPVAHFAIPYARPARD
jgi:hypothetical protein